MAAPITSTYGEYLIKVGDGATPEVFTTLCGLTSKSLDINNNTANTIVPDCLDDDAPAYEEMNITSQSVGVKGTGVFTREKQKFMTLWALNGETHNIRVYLGKSAASDIEYIAGPAILKTLGVSANRGEKLTQALDFMFSEKPVAVLKA